MKDERGGTSRCNKTPGECEANRGWFKRPRFSAVAWGLSVVFAAFAMIAALDLLGLALVRLSGP
jgi:hypothetical protein